MVFVVRCGIEIRCARSTRKPTSAAFARPSLTPKTARHKNSRRARAMEKGTRYGRKAQEEAWQSAEVDALYRLAAAGVRVPAYNFLEGVLLMELVTDEMATRPGSMMWNSTATRSPYPSPRIDEASRAHAVRRRGPRRPFRIQRAVGRRRAGIIDLPQAINAAGNNHAKSMLERDVVNLTPYFGRFAPELLTTAYGKEIWSLYEHGALEPEVKLTGRFERSVKPVDLGSVLREIDLRCR